MEIKFRSLRRRIGDKIREVPLLLATTKIEKFTLTARIILSEQFQENRKVPENFRLEILKETLRIAHYRPDDDQKVCAVLDFSTPTAVCVTHNENVCVDYGLKDCTNESQAIKKLESVFIKFL